MKKLLRIFTLILLVVTLSFTAIGCAPGDNGGSSSEKGILCKKYGNDTFYTVYGYVDDGTTTQLDIDSAVKAKKGSDAVVGKIKTGAFNDNESLTSIIVPQTVQTIMEGAFKGMRRLKEITLPFIGKTGVADAKIGQTFSETKDIDSERTFSYIFGADAYDYGSQVTANYGGGASTYYLPATLEKVIVSNQKEQGYSIPAYAFAGVNFILEVELNGKINAIGEYAFSGCRAISSVNIPATVEKIYNNAFQGCESLKNGGLEFAQNSTLTEIGEKAFYQTEFTEFTIPQSVKTIGDECFAQSKLQTVTLPQGLESIGPFAFYNCQSLESVNFNQIVGALVIRNGAFQYCQKLTAPTNASFIIDSTAFIGTK